MNVPTGYTALDMVGFTDKGMYNSATAYVKNDIAHYGGNLWRCLIDDTTGVTPTEGVNWTVFLAEPTSAAEDIIAQVETTSTAAHSYAVGKQLIYNDTLYTVTSAITVGDTLTVGTNITASDSIVDQLDTKANSSDLATVATTGAYSDLSGKPTLGTAAEKNVPASGDASTTEVVMGDDSRLTNARNAADVSAWAKAANKPTYNGAEILTSTAKTGTAQLSITDTVASGTTMDNVVGTMLDNDKTLDTNITSLNEALTNEVSTRSELGAHNCLLFSMTDIIRENNNGSWVGNNYVDKGVTYTCNTNGSIKVNSSGASASGYFVYSRFLLASDYEGYILNGNPNGATSSDWGLYVRYYDSSKTLKSEVIFNGNEEISIISDSNHYYFDVCIIVFSGKAPSNVMFYPMLRLTSDTDPTYQPYAMTNRELTKSTLYFTSVACAATTGNFATVSDANISADHVVVECTFANPSAITTDVTWTTANGSLTLNGTCASATTANITLSKKGN